MKLPSEVFRPRSDSVVVMLYVMVELAEAIIWNVYAWLNVTFNIFGPEIEGGKLSINYRNTIN